MVFKFVTIDFDIMNTIKPKKIECNDITLK